MSRNIVENCSICFDNYGKELLVCCTVGKSICGKCLIKINNKDSSFPCKGKCPGCKRKIPDFLFEYFNTISNEQELLLQYKNNAIMAHLQYNRAIIELEKFAEKINKQEHKLLLVPIPNETLSDRFDRYKSVTASLTNEFDTFQETLRENLNINTINYIPCRKVFGPNGTIIRMICPNSTCPYAHKPIPCLFGMQCVCIEECRFVHN